MGEGVVDNGEDVGAKGRPHLSQNALSGLFGC